MAEPITRRTLLSSLAASALFPPQPARPNILFILPDQVRPADLSFNGGVNVQTPQIDRLTRQGVTFTNALSTCPLCTPYRGMLLSGQYPTHTGMLLNWIESNPGDPSLALSLRAAGYRTGHIGKWHLNAGKMKHDGLLMSQEARELEAAGDYSRRPRLEQEYIRRNPEPEFVPPGPARRGFDYWAAYNFHTEFRRCYYYGDSSQRLYMSGYETDGETNLAIDFIGRQAAAKQPFFLVVSPHPPHQPWISAQAPEGYLERVRPRIVRAKNVPPDAPRERGDLRFYYAMLANVDDNVGRLMDYLETSGLVDNTIVVFSSDHGEMMGSHGKWEKMAPYEEAVRVPLIVRWPGRIAAGGRCESLYTPMDHLPTLLSLAGLTVPAGLDGIDLSAQLLGRSATERDAALLMNYSSHWDYFHTEWPWPEWRAVRTRRHTYVKWYSGREELFDNEADPFQMRDLINADVATRDRLRTRLRELLRDSHDDFLPGPAYAAWYDSERNIHRTALGPVRRPTMPA